MKNFDLEAAKRGAAVCTRDGRNARIIAFGCKGCGRKPILALIDMGDWEQAPHIQNEVKSLKISKTLPTL